MEKVILLVFIFISILVDRLEGICTQQEARYYYDGSMYFETVCEEVNRETASQLCRSRGGWLAEMHETITGGMTPLTQATHFYTGLIKKNSDWIWETSGRVATTSDVNWATNNPTDGGTKKCAVLGAQLYYTEWDCEKEESLICQFNICSTSNPCTSAGERCVTSSVPLPNNNGYKDYCECKPGYYNIGCAEDYCSVENPCKNGGTCSSTVSVVGYNCHCTPGYMGTNCTEQKCWPNCEHGGTCIASGSGLGCSCMPGYYGDYCNEDYCSAEKPCKNGGTCSSNLGDVSYNCDCTPGYTGTNCTEQKCWPNCEHGGTCIASGSGLECSCMPGYYGDYCNEDYCTAKVPCENGGTCSSDLGDVGYTCHCTPEYNGTNCTDRVFHNSDDCNYYINYHVNDKKGFSDANSICGGLNGTLAMVKTTSLGKFLSGQLKEMYDDESIQVWLGGKKVDSEWKWIDESKIRTGGDGYQNWGDRNPIDENGCLLMKGSSDAHGWYGELCTNTNGWICEVPVSGQEPCSTEPCAYGRCEATGCQWKCICDAGYFMQTCDKDLIAIETPEKLTGVKGDPLQINVTITSFDEPVYVDVLKDGTDSKTLGPTRNGTVTFNILVVEVSSAGSYVFVARPENRSYNRTSETIVNVDVRAYIESISKDFIYAPVSGGSPSNVNCTVGGKPFPNFAWYLDDGKMVANETEGIRVYQTFHGSYALLHVENAISADGRNYTCVSSNTVGNETLESIQQKDIQLSVYGSPKKLSPTGMPCSAVGQITIDWMPDDQTMNVNHMFTAKSVNATTDTRKPIGVQDYTQNVTYEFGQEVVFNELLPYMEYEILVLVCPQYGCISQLNKSERATTGHGLPGKVTSLSKAKTEKVCRVSWSNVTSTPRDQVTEYQIQWLEKIRYEVTAEVKDVEVFITVPASTSYSEIEMNPNREYSAKVTAATCAGKGEEATAVGECVTEKEAPKSVPEPSVSQTEERDTKRQVDISMVKDESNGAISCVFVVLFEEGNSKPVNSQEDLNKLSANALNENNLNEGYIALALKRTEIEIGETITVILGDNKRSECDISGPAATNDRRRRSVKADESYPVKASNIELDYKGTKYTMLTVTVTPINNNSFAFANSPEVTFTQGEYLGIIAAYVLVPLAIIAIAVGAWIYWRRQRKQADKNKTAGQVPMRSNRHFTDLGSNSQIYDNVAPEAKNTTIIFKGLKEYYVMMKANEGMHFRDQYAELKRTAKELAPPVQYGSTDEAMTKNRYKNILPYDHARVHLTGEGLDSYINACHVAGHRKNFIAAQGPLPNTISDFWRMIIEYESKVVVMLTNCDESGRRKCEKYWPDRGQSVSFGSYHIRNIKELDAGGIVIRILKINIPGRSDVKVTQFHYVRWPDHGVPLTTSTFFRLHKKVMLEHESSGTNFPIVVHCSAGVGRTGTFIGFDILLGTGKNSVDIYNCVMNMRKDRPDMVQTSEQFQMLHKIMLENYLFSNTDVEANNLAKKRKNKAMLMEEFRNLKEAESFSTKPESHSGGSSTKVIIVRQAEDTEWVKIDAAFVEAYDSNTYFIASEGPTNSTVEYFLRAMWDNGIDVVVMLNNPYKEDKDPEAQYSTYWPTEKHKPATFNSITIELTREEECRGTMERTFVLSRRNSEPMEVKQYQYLGWTSEFPPENGDGIIDLVKRIQDIDLGRPATVMVHCTDGLGRTGVFITVANIIRRLQAEHCVDVFRAIKDLRDIRPGMVQNLVQYQLCYDMALYYLSNQNVYANDAMDMGEEEEEADPIYQNVVA